MPAGGWLKKPTTESSWRRAREELFAPAGMSDSDGGSGFSDGGFDYNTGNLAAQDVGMMSDFDEDFDAPQLTFHLQVEPAKPRLLQPLRFAIYNGTPEEVVEHVRKLKSSDNFGVNDILDEQWTSLMHACHAGRPDIVECLIDEGADSTFANCDLLTCLMPLACSINKDVSKVVDCAKLILGHAGVDVDAKEAELGSTALHLAVKENQLELVQLLIQHGANVNLYDTDRCSPLHWAAGRGYGPIANVLLEGGASLDQLNNGGLLPYELAAFEGFPKTAKALYDYAKSPNPKELILEALQGNEISTFESSRRSRGGLVQRDVVADVLSQLKMRKYQPLFENKGLKLTQFLQMRDEDFKSLGIQCLGDRLKLMDSIRQMHNHDWKPTSVVNFPPNSFIAIPDTVFLCQNIESQLDLMAATMLSLTQRAGVHSQQASILNPGLERKEKELGRIREYSSKLAQAAGSLINSSVSFMQFISKIEDNVEYKLGDYF